MHWCTYDKELFAISASIEHFEPLIRGRPLIVFTDHGALTHMFTANKNSKLERRSRQIEYISQYTTDIRHISGLSSIVADALSRLEVDEIHATVTPQIIAEEQSKDNEMQQILKNKDSKYEI